jgi:N6-adenosine-specific RNA methylase IME4
MKYRTIVADPPWPMKDSGSRTHSDGGCWDKAGAGMAGKRSVLPYDVMTIDAISNLPVEDLAEDDAHLYLWAVNAYLEDAYMVARWWGFKPSTLLTWCKPPMGLGLGGTYVNTTEFVLFCRRGTLPALRRWPSTWHEAGRQYVGASGPTHSAKPLAFTDIIEQVSPGPYLEMFARRNRLGWDTWGNECRCDVEMVTP